MADQNIMNKIADRLLRAELSAAGARDVDAAVRAVGIALRVDEHGEFYAVDMDGVPRIKLAPGYPKMGLDEVLDETKRNRPELFGGPSLSPGKVKPNAEANPFVKGKDFSITQQMILMNTDPERAEFLAAEAGTPIGTLR